MKLGIVGGGLMGLALAQRLTQKGHNVSVFEGDEQLGGLATHHQFGDFVWDRFYHVILPTDGSLINFIKDIGLDNKLRWKTTLTGFYIDEQFYSLSSSLEFLTFPPLSLWNKFRLALTIIYCARINDWKSLEGVPVEDWLIKVSGKGTYEKMWKPLLLAKLGENYKRVSAVFIWSYIKRLYSARDTSAQKESMGYVSGGYKTVFERLAEIITDAGGYINKKTPVQRITSAEDKKIKLESALGEEVFDKVIFTSPVNVLEKVATNDIIEIQNTGKDVEYSGVICMVLVTKEPLIPYYTLNIADAEIPFTGVIGMTSVVSTDEMAGYHVTYLPKYVHSDDPLMSATDEEIKELFNPGLEKMFPKFKSEQARSIHINRASKVQPLQVLNFSKIVPKVHMCHENFFVLNTAQFVNNTLNNNTVIQAVDNFMSDYKAEFD